MCHLLLLLFFHYGYIRVVTLFSYNKGTFPKIWGHFYLSDETIPERSRSKTSTALTVLYNLLTLDHLRRLPLPNNTSPLFPIFYALFSFWNGHPFIIETTFHSIHPPSSWSTSPPLLDKSFLLTSVPPFFQ